MVLDTAENLTQIGQWSLDCFVKEKQRIALYITLTRKNLTALESFPLSPSFTHEFKKFCTCYEKLEKEFTSGVADRKVWGQGMLQWGTALTQHVNLII